MQINHAAMRTRQKRQRRSVGNLGMNLQRYELFVRLCVCAMVNREIDVMLVFCIGDWKSWLLDQICWWICAVKWEVTRR